MKIAGKWVPAEPTDEMLDAGLDPWDKPTTAKPSESYPYQRSIYAAMLAAAPQPDIEAMVEDCAASLPGNLYASWAVVPGDRKQHYRAIARAVLRHLFGGSA